MNSLDYIANSLKLFLPLVFYINLVNILFYAYAHLFSEPRGDYFITDGWVFSFQLAIILTACFIPLIGYSKMKDNGQKKDKTVKDN